ncbi:pimeloyl-ACP methyl ester carboxylesterase [Variovorax beijingensis]|uniref:Pimeloyl-ACP methyl ester carboxylesterase n=1 Tax=Variovorax beijingensis TaxID=2496117 RepID=A0A561B419_9BURK|nr:alpha/beta hydrolase [Variovorax beijingensis]TWD73636.1 pimeloyl-ACP methyl ester carboxylesterase [Variovorax beijingensis]
MNDRVDVVRRGLLRGAVTSAGIAGLHLALAGSVACAKAIGSPALALTHLKNVDAGVLNIAYYEAGPANGPAVVLLHGFPYDIEAYAEVAPILTTAGCRVIVPYLRGFGPTRFLSAQTLRSGEFAAFGADLLALLDALALPRAVLAGYDWGGKAASAVAALWPERCAGLVSGNGYAFADPSAALIPAKPESEIPLWWQFYFQTERGRAGYAKYRREFNRLFWKQWSPTWRFDDATFARTAASFDNADHVAVSIHSFRHRFGAVKGDPAYFEIDRKLASLPAIPVRTVTLDGSDDGAHGPTDGSAQAAKFTGPRSHRVVPGAGHNLPQEAPSAFAAAVLELVRAERSAR